MSMSHSIKSLSSLLLLNGDKKKIRSPGRCLTLEHVIVFVCSHVLVAAADADWLHSKGNEGPLYLQFLMDSWVQLSERHRP